MSERNPNLVELRPIENVRWHGKSGKDNFAQDKSSQILYNPSTGKYATGLTEEEAKKIWRVNGSRFR